MLRKIFSAVGTGVFAVVAMVIAAITTFAIPVVAILWIGHLGPFAKHTASPSSIAFCSTLNQMTSYAASHPTPTTASQFVTQISYSRDQLARVGSIPSDIKGTVSAALTTSNQILSLLQGVITAGGWSGNEQQQTVALDRVFITEASTLKKWYYSNC